MFPIAIPFTHIGGVMLVVYEYDRTRQNVLDSNLISIIAKNYLYGVLK